LTVIVIVAPTMLWWPCDGGQTGSVHTASGDTPIMKEIRQPPVVDEPVGIIISRGSREEVLPRVLAYIWGPVPAEDESASRAA
jgi:hypothetical protein